MTMVMTLMLVLHQILRVEGGDIPRREVDFPLDDVRHSPLLFIFVEIQIT